MVRYPLVSICIPSYNHARFLPTAIETALAQTYRNFEILVADDGSSDDSLEIAQRYAARYPSLIRVFTHPNRAHKGISATTNLAWHHANGSYWSGLASDDAYYPDKLEQQVALLESNPTLGLVFSYAHIIDDTGKRLPGVLGYDISRDPNPVWRLLLQNQIAGLTAMIRRACFHEVGLHDEALIYSDWELWIRILARWHVGFIDKPLAMYRIHGDNTSAGISPEARIRHVLAVMAALRQKAPIIGGALSNPRTQALIHLQIAYLSFCVNNDTDAVQSFGLAFRTDASLRSDAGCLAKWLRGCDPKFVRWTLKTLPIAGGRPVRLFASPLFVSVLIRKLVGRQIVQGLGHLGRQLGSAMRSTGRGWR